MRQEASIDRGGEIQELPAAIFCILATYFPVLIASFSSRYIEELIIHTLAFLWLPIVLVLIFSVALKVSDFNLQNYEIDFLKRVLAFLFGNLFCLIHIYFTTDRETFAIAFVLYSTIAFPMQILLSLFIKLLQKRL